MTNPADCIASAWLFLILGALVLILHARAIDRDPGVAE